MMLKSLNYVNDVLEIIFELFSMFSNGLVLIWKLRFGLGARKQLLELQNRESLLKMSFCPNRINPVFGVDRSGALGEAKFAFCQNRIDPDFGADQFAQIFQHCQSLRKRT